MKFRRPALLYFALLVAGAMLVFLNTLVLSRDESIIRRLPDRSVLRIAKITSGSVHTFSLPKVAPWKSYLARYLPAAWTAGQGWWAEGGSATFLSPTNAPVLGIFAVCDHIGTNRSSDPAVLIATDESGTESTPAFCSPAACGLTVHYTELDIWMVKVPTNSESLHLKFYPATPNHSGHPIADFKIKNPLYKSGEK